MSQFILVNDMGTGRVLAFEQDFNRHTTLQQVTTAIRDDLPADARVVWHHTDQNCYQVVYSSKTLAGVLGVPQIGDARGLVLVELESGDIADVPPWRASDVTRGTDVVGSDSQRPRRRPPC